MLNLIIGRSGYGKTFEINSLIKNMRKAGKTDIILLVPEQASFESEREILQLLSASELSYIDVLSFTRLCDRFFNEYGARKNRCIDETGRTALMELSLKAMTPELKLFKKQAKTPQFSRSLLNLVEQMKRFNVTPDLLMSASERSNGILKTKLYEISLILSDYQQRINNEYYDPLDDLTLMAKMLTEHKFFENKTVFIDSFKGFTAQQFAVLEKIIVGAKDVYISLGFDGYISAKNDMSLFANVADTARTIKDIARRNGVKISPDIILTESHRFKSDELIHLEKNIFAQDFLIFEESAQNITVCKAKTIYDEADYAAHTIRKLVRTENRRYRDFAVIARDSSRYKGIIDAAFERYGVPCFIDDRNTVETMAIFKLAVYAMQSVISGFDTDDIMSMLKTRLTELNEDDISLLDNYTTIWKINGSDWENDWVGNPSGMAEEFSDEDKSLLNKINSLREYIFTKLQKLQRGMGSTTAKGISTAVYEFITAVGANNRLLELSNKLQSNGYVQIADSERRSYDIFINLMDQMVMALDKTDIDMVNYFNMFCDALTLCDIGSLPQGLDEVMVGSAERMRPKSPKITFVIGANEGVFPAVPASGGMFTDNELKSLETGGVQLPYFNESSATDESYLAYSALCSASEKLFVTYAGADAAGNQLEPSQIVNMILDIFIKCNVENDSIGEDIYKIENVDSALTVLAKNMNSQSVSAASLDYYFKHNSNSKYDALIKAASPRNFELSANIATSLYGKNIYTSASKIDVFHKCKFYYFCKYGIKAKLMRVAELDVLQRGTLVHYVLEQCIKNYTTEYIVSICDDELRSLVAKLTSDYMSTIIDGRKMEPQELFTLEQLVEIITQVVRRIYEDLQQSEFTVCDTELGIGGESSDISAMELELDDGGKVVLTGKIDRVDIFEKNGNKYIRILDYKTGNKTMDLSDVLYGQNLQMLVYMLALQKGAAAKYGKDIVPAGILYIPAKATVASFDPTVSDDEIKTSILKDLRMKGIVLNDANVINAMEPGCAGMFTPVRLKKDGLPMANSPIYTLEQYGMLARHIEQLLKKMGQALHNGEISAKPLDGVNSGACDYCDYRTVCQRDSNLVNEKITALKSDEIFEAIKTIEDGEDSGV